MEIKKCRVCNISKPLTEFYRNNGSYRYCCKECSNKQSKKYREENKEKIKKLNSEYSKTHKEEANIRAKEWYKDNKERKKQYDKEYRIKNKDKINNRYKKRKKNDKIFFLKCKISSNIRHSFVRKKCKMNYKLSNILCCDLNYCAIHLLETFKNNYGYEWNGVEKVAIDHIIPLKKAQNENDVIKLCNYKNLQLLRLKDNIKKSDKENMSVWHS